MTMDERVARALLDQEIQPLRELSYAALVALIDQPVHRDVLGPDGKTYLLEVNVHWDHKPGGDVRVFVMVDDGGWRFWHPLGEDFIKSPSGEFVGE
jgi:hypothetical protein